MRSQPLTICCRACPTSLELIIDELASQKTKTNVTAMRNACPFTWFAVLSAPREWAQLQARAVPPLMYAIGNLLFIQISIVRAMESQHALLCTCIFVAAAHASAAGQDKRGSDYSFARVQRQAASSKSTARCI
jgi:hypothetical protein